MDDLFNTQHKENEKYKNNIELINRLKNRVVNNLEEAINLDEIERLAYSKLDMNTLSYFMSGANNEETLRRNKEQFKKVLLYPKILKDVSNTDISTTILGNKISMPIMIAPSALHKMAHEDGEIATAKASKNANTLMILSTLSSSSIERVAAANENGLRWQQLYITKTRDETIEIIKEAERNKYTGLVLTVDAPVLGYRERDFQVKFKVPQGIFYENLINLGKDPNSALSKYKSSEKNLDKVVEETGKNSALFSYFSSNIDSSLTWEIIQWLKKITKLPIILKGVHRVDDALKAQAMGVEGIIISNHGARQLDSVPSTIEMLYPICQALKKIKDNKMEVYCDGGFTRGSDVFKAVAMGAKGVFLGRPIIWGLTCGGHEGVRKVLDLIRNEFLITMKLCGCTNVNEINEDFIRVKHNFAKF
jgi:isopentenyl diphosphate isomerase/L-lactate dehydrogenase-like FMN-dependent dehydrogenase